MGSELFPGHHHKLQIADATAIAAFLVPFIDHQTRARCIVSLDLDVDLIGEKDTKLAQSAMGIDRNSIEQGQVYPATRENRTQIIDDALFELARIDDDFDGRFLMEVLGTGFVSKRRNDGRSTVDHYRQVFPGILFHREIFGPQMRQGGRAHGFVDRISALIA